MFEDWTNCQICEHNPTGDKCELFGRVIGMNGCSSAVERKPRNNFERLKSMSMDEFTELFAGKCCPTIFADKMVVNTNDCAHHFAKNECEQCWNNWLKEAIE